MRALLPVYCRPLGYFIIALALFLPFIFLLWGKVTDANLLFYKECSKLLMMMGALMIIFALTKNENKEMCIRDRDRAGAQQVHAQCHLSDRSFYLRRYALPGGAG